MTYALVVEIQWDPEDVDYIQSRSMRYPHALDIRVDWTHEALADPLLVEVTPYPRSRLRASGFIGWSSGANRIVVVIGYRDLDGDLHGINAWPASGRDLATYTEGVPDDQED